MSQRAKRKVSGRATHARHVLAVRMILRALQARSEAQAPRTEDAPGEDAGARAEEQRLAWRMAQLQLQEAELGAYRRLRSGVPTS